MQESLKTELKREKIWLKQCTRGLFAKVLNFQGLATKKLGAKNLIQPYTQGLACKNSVLDGGFYY